jgi:hypothetical protein
VFRSRAERKVAEAGYDPARLPPGQYLTEKWPVLHAGDVPSYPPDLEGWDFRVHGEVDESITLTWDELNDLPKVSVTQDIHCVTRWSRFDAEFTGVPWSAIRELVGSRPSAHYAIAHAEAGFTANVPASSLDAEGALLASTSGRAPSGCARSSSARPTRPVSGSATATTTTPIPGRKSGTPSDPSRVVPGSKRAVVAAREAGRLQGSAEGGGTRDGNPLGGFPSCGPEKRSGRLGERPPR